MIRTLMLLAVLTIANTGFAKLDKDNELYHLSDVLNHRGTIQPDIRTFEIGAREWEIKIVEKMLEGETAAEIDKSWKKFIAIENRKMFEIIKDEAIDVYEDAGRTDRYFSQDFIAFINDETDIVLEYSYGNGSQKKGKAIAKWFKAEILTRAAKQRLVNLLDSKDLGIFDVVDWTRFHFDNTAAELIGTDIILMRGVKRILRIEISYDAI